MCCGGRRRNRNRVHPDNDADRQVHDMSTQTDQPGQHIIGGSKPRPVAAVFTDDRATLPPARRRQRAPSPPPRRSPTPPLPRKEETVVKQADDPPPQPTPRRPVAASVSPRRAARPSEQKATANDLAMMLPDKTSSSTERPG